MEYVLLNPQTLEEDPNGLKYIIEMIGNSKIITSYSEVTNPIIQNLDEYKTWKKNKINDDYNLILKSGFKSNTPSENLIYGYSDSDQNKWIKLFLSVSNSVITYPVPISTMDNTINFLDESQIKQLLMDINTWEWTNQERLHVLWAEVDACESITEASVINF